MFSRRFVEATPWLRVWDPVVRIGHWLLVASVLTAWVTRHRGGSWHDWSGYLAMAVVLVRLSWGWRGRGPARFGSFVLGPRRTFAYARAVLAGSEPRSVGHNPLGGWMIVALLATVAALGLTGWLFNTDLFWGEPWLDALHGLLADLLMALVALHVLGVLYASLRHRENLVAAMVHGRKRGPTDS